MGNKSKRKRETRKEEGGGKTGEWVVVGYGDVGGKREKRREEMVVLEKEKEEMRR